jgi:hypothetical protein
MNEKRADQNRNQEPDPERGARDAAGQDGMAGCRVSAQSALGAGKESTMDAAKGVSVLFCTALVLTWGMVEAAEGEKKKDAKAEVKKEVKHQTMCPIMGGKINKKLFVDHDGKRVYVCCAGCIGAVRKEAAKYIKKLEGQGITLAKTPVALCHKCGEIKGTAKCCKTEGREKCKKCNLLKGSVGCCKLAKGTKAPAVLCHKCGEIKGTKKCCKIEGRDKCKKCNLLRGSVGCCKLGKVSKAEKAEAKHTHGPNVECAKCDAHKGAAKKTGKAKEVKKVKKAAGCCGGCGGR